MLQAAAEAGLDPDRLSFTEAVFQISQAIDDGLVFAPEHRERLAQRLRRCLRHKLLPARHLRMNRREVKQVYNKRKPMKRGMPPPEPFQAHERFEDFVVIEVRYPLPTSKQEVLLVLN